MVMTRVREHLEYYPFAKLQAKRVVTVINFWQVLSRVNRLRTRTYGVDHQGSVT